MVLKNKLPILLVKGVISMVKCLRMKPHGVCPVAPSSKKRCSQSACSLITVDDSHSHFMEETNFAFRGKEKTDVVTSQNVLLSWRYSPSSLLLIVV